MRLAEALTSIPQERLRAISAEVDPGNAELPTPLMASRIEAVVKSPTHVEHCVARRRPPVLALLEILLEAEHAVAIDECRARSMEMTEQLCNRVGSGDLLAHDGCELYRRVMLEAWRSDLQIDESEASLLGVLRRELGMTRVEHFLTAHHPDVRAYWDDGNPFLTVKRALEDAGILFDLGEVLVLPEDLVPAVRNAVGLHLDRAVARRLFEALRGVDIKWALDSAALKTSGSKAAKIDRLLEHYVSPKDVLDHVHILDLRGIAASVGCKKSGSKPDLMNRLIAHFGRGSDLVVEEDEPESGPEPKRLEREPFFRLFESLSGQELGAILWKLRDEIAQTGTKTKKVTRLWESPFSEETLLSKLGNRALADILERRGLQRAGSKGDRIERLISSVGGTTEMREGTVAEPGMSLDRPSDEPTPPDDA